MFGLTKINVFRYFKGSLNSGVRNSCSFVRIVDLKLTDDGKDLINVKGWVKAVRKMKHNIFFDVSDGSSGTPLQIVVTNDKDLPDVQYGASVEVSGKLCLNRNSQMELCAQDVKVIGTCSLENYPFAPRKSYSNDYIRQFLHLRPRLEGFTSLFRIRNQCCHAIHDFYRNRNYIQVHTPVLTSNDCEGGGEVFSVNAADQNQSKDLFFDQQTFLTVSSQLHLEIAARSLSQVYCLGPTFRAENSKSRLHLSEFYMLEAESTLLPTLNDLQAEVESLIHHITCHLLNHCSKDLEICRKALGCDTLKGDSLNSIEDALLSPFGNISYEQAAEILLENHDKLNVKFQKGEPLKKEHEFFLVKHNGGVPLFISEWPRDIKPFYMKSTENHQNKVMAFDLIATNVGEICGGSVREDSYDKLKKTLCKHELENNLDWYLELRKHGNVLTAGYGLGFERYLQVLLCILNIKDAIPFPRWPHNCLL